ncbi:DUF6531 domain-containing protein, partial [Streptomyces sp. B1866]|uniref:DUF6531 domain-containing protein n=1 Tax=Streptomyces sp. B1866 TaxID=3075431 RepID=UPI0028917B57
MSLEDTARHVLLKLGMWWPEANSGTLRHAADAWREFADSVDGVRIATDKAARTLIEHNRGEAIEAFADFWSRYAKGRDGGWLSDTAEAARSMAKALEKFADTVDDAIEKLWTQIGIDALAIAGGAALAVFTGGASEGVAAGIVEMSAGLGVAVSAEVAAIAAEMLAQAVFQGVYSVTIDAAVAQPVRIALGQQRSFSLEEVDAAAKDGMLVGGLFGGVLGGLEYRMSPWLAQLTGRPASLRLDLVKAGEMGGGRSAEGLACRPARACPSAGEPVDVASGAMWMVQTDLSLPGRLPLVFERTHLSSYRSGVCFGPTWSCLLDERVQLDAEGVVFAAADGMRLVYPVPEPGAGVLPVKGARWPLEWDGKPGGVMTVTDPHTGVVRTFTYPGSTGVPGTVDLPLESVQDRGGARIDIDRTEQGAPTAIRHSGGYHVAVDTQGPRVTALRLLDEPWSGYEPETAADAGTGAGTVVMRY